MSDKKGLKNAPKKGGKEEQIYQLDLTLEVLEIGNMSSSETVFFMDASFMGNSMKKETDGIFEACHCGPVDVVNFKWTLPIKIKGEENIIDLSANPIVVSWSKLNTEYEEEIPNPLLLKHLDVQGYAFVDLIDIITDKIEDVTRIVNFQSIVKCFGSDVKTWPNVPFIKCRLITSKPVLKESKEEYNTISVTFESIFNFPEDLLTKDCCSYQLGIVLPFSTNLSKILICQNGRLIEPTELPTKKLYCTLSHFDHQAKLTVYPANVSYSPGDIKFPNENGKLQDDLLEDNDHLVSFYGIYKCMIKKTTLQSLIKSKNLAIEVFIKNQGKLEHFVGLVDLTRLTYVGETQIRMLVPLRKFDLQLISSNCGHNKSVFSTGPKPKESPKKMKPKSKKNPKQDEKNEVPSAPEILYISNENGYTTCVAIDIEIGYPILSKQTVQVDITSISQISTPEVYASKVSHTNKELNFLFEREIGNFLKAIKGKDTLSIDSNEGDMFGAAEALISKRFNFAEATDQESRQDILENAYIYIVNKIHEVLDPDCSNSREDDLKDVHLRYFRALECFELGMLDDARDFYIMNIRDTRNCPEPLVLFAMHCLFIGDMQMCLECCTDALKKDPKCYICYVLQAYVAFVYKDTNSAEQILKRLTLCCENFVEVWMALFVIYYQADKKSETKFAQKNVFMAQKNPCTTYFHNKSEIAWVPMKTDDVRLNSITKFIQWGCLDFAEICLCWIIQDYGYNSYEYLYYMALIEYYRKNYTNALQRLGGIKLEKPFQRCNKLKLRIHCLLNLESLAAINDIRELLKISSKRESQAQIDIIHLKLGKIYIATKKYKAALFYLKQCRHKSVSFAAYALLGEVNLKRQWWERAECCFKVAYSINPFNGVSWAYLAIIYFRKNLIPQYQLCKTNARQNRLDNKLSEELEKLEAAFEQRKRNKICELKKKDRFFSQRN